MKYIIILLLLVSCNDSKPNREVDFKFHTGDIAYIKVDLKRCVISSRTIIRDTQPAYYVDYIDEDGDYTESLIGEYCLTDKNK